GIDNQNQNGNGNVVATRAKGNANGNNGNKIRCCNCRGLDHLARNCTVRPQKRDVTYLQTQLLIAQKQEGGIQLQAEEFDLMVATGDIDEIEEVNANCILIANLQQASTSGTETDKSPVYDLDGSAEAHEYDHCYNNEIFNMFTQEEQYTHLLEPIPESHQVQQNDSNVISAVSKAAKFVRDFKSLANEADESLAKHKALEFDIVCLLRAVVSEQKDTTKGTSVNTQFRKQSILGKPPSSSGPKLYSVTPLPKSKVILKVGESNALSKSVTSNSAPSSRESIVVNNERVIAPGIFRINPFKAHRVDNFVPNKHVKASATTKPITGSQPHVITKKDVNFITNGFSSKNIESTTRNRRPQPMNNPKSDKVPFKSTSSCLSNKLEKIEENLRSLQSSDYPDHTSYKQKANVKKSKMLSSEDRLASSRPRKPRTCLKWLPTGRIFDLCGKITPSNNTESESDTSVCDNASASNPQKPTNKGFPSSTSFLGMFLKLQRQNSCIYPLAIF
ncbi:hypothetical protein Tco_1367001, partial [Tanacetum coccineum]